MSDTTLPPLKLLSIHCPHCPTSPVTYITLGELEAHFLECHYRPVPETESLRRLATEEGLIGRTPPAYDPLLGQPCAHCGVPLALYRHASILCSQWMTVDQEAGTTRRTPPTGKDAT